MKANSSLEQMLFDSIEKKTPDYIKENKVFDYSNLGAFSFVLKREHLLPKTENNPLGLNLEEWLKNYEKEALVSTAGIRGPQNVLYPHDTRFPINTVGVMLATLGKSLSATEKYSGKELVKLVGCEVRYNSKIFLDIISRIQAAKGIKTLVPFNKETIPIWLASFLAFKLDLLGGEYITSSHGISVKNATKDLNDQGSQYLPEESIEFVNKIKKVFETVKKNGEYEIKFSAVDDKLIDQDFMQKIENGINLYVEYLKNGVANEDNLKLIKNVKEKIIIENVGGSAYKTLSKVLNKLDIENSYNWLNAEEDPFFHSIGKDLKDNEFYDWSLDITVSAKKDGKSYFPVIETLKYDEKLKDYPLNTMVLITDPDHDRLSVVQIEDEARIPYLEENGIQYTMLNDRRILTVFSANQAFLMIMDFWLKQLKTKGLFDKHPRFMIKTTASSRSWDEWAKKNDVIVINVPVGFKEIANIMKKVEGQLGNDEVIIQDIFGVEHNLGKNPRLIFGGEESGGMIIGAEELIESQNKRSAIAMREKSATEAIIVASALQASLTKPLSDHLLEILNENSIISRFDAREDISYYNESEADIDKLKSAKLKGEEKRTKNDLFFLTLALAKDENKITLEQIKEILSSTFPTLNFSNLEDIKFVGDGTYFNFADKFVEIRPSGTDAKTKAYSGGNNSEEISEFARLLGNYPGDFNQTYTKYLEVGCAQTAKMRANFLYEKFVQKHANLQKFEIPKYNF